MKRNRWSAALVVGLLMIASGTGSASEPGGPIASWTLWPDHRLPERAGDMPDERPPQPQTSPRLLSLPTRPVLLNGEAPVDRRQGLLLDGQIPRGPFSIELWVLDHVDQVVGAMATVRRRDGEPVWALTYHGRMFRMVAEREDGGEMTLLAPSPRGWKYVWRHAVGTYDGRELRLYLNGMLAQRAPLEGLGASDADELDFELAGYFEDEPYMRLGHLVKGARVFDRALDVEEIRSRFTELQGQVDAGLLRDDAPHRTFGPYLNSTTTTSTRVLWETSEPTTALVRWGRTSDLEQSIELEGASRLHEAELTGLEPGTGYFYRVESTTASGEGLDSGLLSFKTAPEAGRPFRFAIVGDTEARPHVNARLSELIWGERPEFVINVGDLTDGGRQARRFEWTHEYFVGMGALHQRVPAFPVPGNGEGDLVWYSHYHTFDSPDDMEGYYTFRWGDAQFFMLDSNRRGEGEFAPGGEQYEWLDRELAASDATWKFAAHHHPTFTSDEDDYGDTWRGLSEQGDTRVRPIVELYEKHGVDAVFFGHLHTYERTHPIKEGRVTPGGVVYIQAGGGGGNLEDFAPTATWFSGKTYRGHHYCMVFVEPDRVEIRLYDSERNMLDVSELRK